MKRRGIILRILAVMAIAASWLLCFAVSAFATAAPDSTPTISDIKANTYLIEEGDVLIYGKCDISYTSIPADDADKTYTLTLLDTDGSTILGTYNLFNYYDSGYNEQVFGFYFSASDNLTSDQTYTIRIAQNPLYFASPQTYDYVMPLSAWTDSSSQEDNQAELTVNIISLAEDLEAAHDETLLESSAGGTVLSDPGGETYFRGAIYGIQAMAPDLFLVQSLTWDTTDTDWDTTEFDSYGTRFSGTFIGTASDNTSGTFGLDTQTFMGLIFTLPLTIGAVVVSQMKWRKAEPGYIAGSLILILVALMGWIDLALFALVFQLFAMYIGYLWFYSRSSGSFDSKMFSFMAWVWISSTLICLVIEGSWLGAAHNTVINDLSAFTALKVGGLVPIPSAALNFFRGVFRMMAFDYSFYTGDYTILRYIYLAVFTGSVVWGMTQQFAPVFANFLRIK